MEQVKIFLDTNILIDYYTGRMEDGVAEKIVIAGDAPCFQLCISVLTGVNVMYVTKKFNRPISASLLRRMFTILPMTASQWEKSLVSDIADPEDALQMACAEENACQVFITRDRHIRNTQSAMLKILSPEEFIAEISA